MLLGHEANMRQKGRFCCAPAAVAGMAAMLWLGCAASLAQTTEPLAEPATEPATNQAAATGPTTTRVRYVATLPPGFVRLSGQGAFWPRVIFCTKDDASWLAAALTPVGPSTRPTTMPSDILAQLQAKRQQMIDRISNDLAITPAQAADELDHHIVPFARDMQSMQPSVIFLITSVPDLRKILRDGWDNRQFRYNAAANESVYMGAHMDIAVGRPADDTVFPVVFDPSNTHETITSRLNQHIRQDESVVAVDVSVRAQSSMQLQFADLLARQAVAPLHAKDDQQWFYVGLLGVLPTRWMAQLTGGDADHLLAGLEEPNRSNPLRAAGFDLSHPMPLSSLQPSAVPLYEDAFRRRSAWIVDYWLQHVDPDSLHKTMVALRANPPADCAALLKTIKTVTGTDLMPELVPQD